MNKVTKKTCLATIEQIVNFAKDQGVGLSDGITYDDIFDFIVNEQTLLETKAAAAAKRAAQKKMEGDELRERVLNTLTTEFQTVPEIVAAMNDPEISAQKVTSRLTQLLALEPSPIVRDQISVAPESGKSRKLAAYKLA